MSTDIYFEILDELNNSIEKEFEDDFSFSLGTDGCSYVIELGEISQYGVSITLFNSEDTSFDGDIEELYEEDKITYKEALIMQVWMNLELILSKFYRLSDISQKNTTTLLREKEEDYG